MYKNINFIALFLTFFTTQTVVGMENNNQNKQYKIGFYTPEEIKRLFPKTDCLALSILTNPLSEDKKKCVRQERRFLSENNNIWLRVMITNHDDQLTLYPNTYSLKEEVKNKDLWEDFQYFFAKNIIGLSLLGNPKEVNIFVTGTSTDNNNNDCDEASLLHRTFLDETLKFKVIKFPKRKLLKKLNNSNFSDVKFITQE
jgi:hypothetical protein